MGLGFSPALFVLGSVRELFGAGSVLGFSLFGVAPPCAFFTLGLLLAANGRDWRDLHFD